MQFLWRKRFSLLIKHHINIPNCPHISQKTLESCIHLSVLVEHWPKFSSDKLKNNPNIRKHSIKIFPSFHLFSLLGICVYPNPLPAVDILVSPSWVAAKLIGLNPTCVSPWEEAIMDVNTRLLLWLIFYLRPRQLCGVLHLLMVV